MVKKVPQGSRGCKEPDQFLLNERALQKQPTATLISQFLPFARQHSGFARELEVRRNLQKPVALRVIEFSGAIDRATAL